MEKSWDPDPIDFANYLLCVNVFLGFRPTRRDLGRKDKSPQQAFLLTTFFGTLASRLSRKALDHKTAANLVKLTIRFAARLDENMNFGVDEALTTEIYRFCSILHFQSVRLRSDWIDVILLLAKVARSEGQVMPHLGIVTPNLKLRDVSWIYDALDHVQQSRAKRKIGTVLDSEWDTGHILVVGDLLRALIHAKGLHQKPKETTLRLILRALSLVDKEVAGLAFFTLHYSRQWFEEEDLGQILQQDSTLTHMGRIALELNHAEGPYLELVDKLSKMRDWKPILYNELPTWIEFVLRTTRGRSQLKKIDSIIRRLWDNDCAVLTTYRFKNQVEELMGCIFAALSNHWEQFKFQSSDLAGFIPLVQCTMSVGLDKHYNGTASHLYEKLSPHLVRILSQLLADALLHAAHNCEDIVRANGNGAEETVANRKQEGLRVAGKILERIGKKIREGPGSSGWHRGNAGGRSTAATESWNCSEEKKGIQQEINILEDSWQSSMVSSQHASLANSRRAPSPPPIATIDRSVGSTHALRTESEIQELPRLHELQENAAYVDSEHLDADYPHGLSWPEITT
ncbi:hypothetical protein B0H11DRAFT_2035314 [Mycena galericulata]|nr:hypothetical protein B0H11DRAFT_2035314 [Mycena galericulata]